MRRSRHNNAVLVQDEWPIRKALTLSDVDITHPFLTLPRQPVETYILVHLTQLERDHLLNREQVAVNAQDDDTGDGYIMKLKWRGSYYNLIGKWGKIVRSKGLDVGKEIKLRWFNGCLHFSVPQQEALSVPPLQIIPAPVAHHDQWPIKKVLTLSDVDTNHPFLPLARRSVEDHILVHWTPQQRELLRNEEQVNLNARDVDTEEMYVMKLRWRGNYYNLIGKWGKIIRSKGLGVGKEIKIRWANGCLHFSVPYEHTVVPETIPVIQQQQQQQQQQLLHHQHHHHHHHHHHHQDWPIKKALTLSDVDTNHPFLTLPGKSIEDHILLYWASQAREQLRNELQINVNARDYDTGDLFLMKLKCRGSYYNLIGKWGQIIRGKGLQVGQEIRYEWKPSTCDHCKIFGHVKEQCLKTVKEIPKKKEVVQDDGFRQAKKGGKAASTQMGLQLNKSKAKFVYRPKKNAEGAGSSGTKIKTSNAFNAFEGMNEGTHKEIVGLEVNNGEQVQENENNAGIDNTSNKGKTPSLYSRFMQSNYDDDDEESDFEYMNGEMEAFMGDLGIGMKDKPPRR